MSDNIVETLVDSAIGTVSLFGKCVLDLISLGFDKDSRQYDWSYFFKEVGLIKNEQVPIYSDFRKEKYYNIYIFKVPLSITIKEFQSIEDNISYFIGVETKDIRLEQVGNKVYLRVRNNISMNFDYDMELHKRNDFKIPIGVNIKTNELMLLDIFKSNNFGVYIAGSSGGGKSITLRLLLSHLSNCKTRRDIEFVIVNTKRVDLKDFEHCRNTVKYQVGTVGIEDLMEEQLEEMERRYKVIEKADCDDIWEYRKKVKYMPFRLVVVEEISAYKDNKSYQRSMELLASQGRGSGIIPILVTQLPTKDIMPSTTKANMNTIIGHKTLDNIRSRVICGEDGLELLGGNGHNKMFNSDYKGIEYQGLYIDKATMKTIINKNKRAVKGATSTTHGDNNNTYK